MADITLQLDAPEGPRRVPLAGESLTVGRDAGGRVAVAGEADLTRRLATFCRSGERAWVVACSTSDGLYVNDWPVPPEGRVLADGDEVRLGQNGAVVRVSFGREAAATPAATQTQAAAPPAQQQSSSKTSPLVFLLPVLALALVVLAGLGLYLWSSSTRDDAASAETSDSASSVETDEQTPELSDDGGDGASSSSNADTSSLSSPSSSSAPLAPSGEAAVLSLNNAQTPPDPLPAPPPGSVKLYQQMSDDERREFIKRRAQRVSVMMGRRPYAIPDDAITEIKRWLDAFAKRTGNNQTGMWRGDTRHILERARLYSPTIIRVFKEHNVPVVIGLYIPFIETEYTNISSENAAGAAGLFQFIPATARGYGVDPADRTDVDKMAPAAAKYFRDTIIQFGGDPMSVALAIAGYNRNPESVARDLREVLNEKDNTARERTFWTLIANKSKLDEKFQSENKEYVPRFFAAAILGETPWAFGLDLQPLSTYTQPVPG
ncbi:MAG TPA: transglycosylase SLT domain-containing protein, partial [Pyrinomonadaceae bacterium]|nr:transglycosylase SLT domain-containing protein [Pyrinomonadaceae bacterium]